MHTSNSFLQSSAPTKNFALPSPLHELEKNKQWTRWAITVHRISCSAKEKIDRCNFYAYENLLPNYSREYFYKVKTKKMHSEKTPSTIRRKIFILFGCFSKFFTPCLHLISRWKKYPSIIQRKIQVLLMCFEKKFWLSTKIYSLVVCNVVCKIELWYNFYIKSFTNSCKVGYGNLRAVW